jgi:hypothetical protein
MYHIFAIATDCYNGITLLDYIAERSISQSIALDLVTMVALEARTNLLLPL